MPIKDAGPWRTDNWFVSPWNYLPEVTKDFKPPARVTIHDVTLRDGEQQVGITLRKDDKVRIAEALAELGVHRIEAGMPAMSPADEAAIREIVRRDLGPEIFCFSRCMVDDVKLAADCGVKGVIVEIPSSRALLEHAYGWPMERAIDLSIEATSAARDLGLYTVFFTIDGTRADIDWYLDLIDRVARDGHMDALALVDTFGALSVDGARYYTKRVRERIDKPLEVHFHNDFGLGVANTIAAVLGGAQVIHTTVAGLGERAGNAAMEETALALLTMYGIDVGIDFGKLNDVADVVLELTKRPISPNRPFIGEDAFDFESGIVAGWYQNAWKEHPTEIYPILPAFVGHRDPKMAIGKKSGLPSVIMEAAKLGVSLSEKEARAVTQEVKGKALELGRVLSEDEFATIVHNIRFSR